MKIIFYVSKVIGAGETVGHSTALVMLAGVRFSSQHEHGGSQPSVSTVLGDLAS